MTAFWEKAAHSAYDVFSKNRYLIVNLVSSAMVHNISSAECYYIIVFYLHFSKYRENWVQKSDHGRLLVRSEDNPPITPDQEIS